MASRVQRTGQPSNAPLWGWTVPVRAVIAALTFVLALGLLLQTPRAPAPEPGPPPKLVVDPNAAPVEVLIALPRLGPVLAGRIVEARQDGPFQTVEEVAERVRGIGPVTIAAVRPYWRIDPAPVDP